MAVLNPNAITTLGNFSIDRVDDAEPTPGGCPSFAPAALRSSPGSSVVARLAEDDRPLFAEVLARHDDFIRVLGAETTSAFGLHYDGEERSLTVDAIGDPWSEAEIGAASIDTVWVHLAPLLRSDFPPRVVASLSQAGHRVSLDGQGLVRVPRLGEMELDDDFDSSILDSIDVLKLNEEEAATVAGGGFDLAAGKSLGCGEILVTQGSGGCDVYVGDEMRHVPARPVDGIHPTGAGDVFTLSYLIGRAAGKGSIDAATCASETVAVMLEERLCRESGRSVGR